MIYTYNGVSMEIEHLEISADCIYDESGIDYLYTRFRITVEAIWNPAATQDISVIGHAPPASESFTNVGNALRQPRQSLSIVIPNHNPDVNSGAGVPLITSPAAPNFSGTDGQTVTGTRYLTDAKNGPIVIGNPVIQFTAEKTARISHTVETWLVECSNQRPCVSNRFSMRKTRNQDYFETRIIAGTAIFRSDMLYSAARDANGNLQPRMYPSQFLWQLVPRCPWGFKRVACDPFQHEDGITLDYHVEDVQQPLGISPTAQWFISRIEGSFSDGHTVAQLPMNTARHLLGYSEANESLQGSIARAGGSQAPGVSALVSAFRFDRWVGFGSSVASDVQNSFPSRIVTLELRAYGTPLATKANLLTAILAVAGNYRLTGDAIIGSAGLFAVAARHFILDTYFTCDVWNKVAEFRLVMKLPGAVGFALSVSGIANPPSVTASTSSAFDPTLEEMAPIATVAQLTAGPAGVPAYNGQTQENIPTPAAVPPPNSPCVSPATLDAGNIVPQLNSDSVQNNPGVRANQPSVQP